MQLDAMHPLQIWMDPPGICKVSNTNMLISPLNNVPRPTASTCCLSFTSVVGGNSFSKMCVYSYARCFVQCYRACCVISVGFVVLTKVLFTRMLT